MTRLLVALLVLGTLPGVHAFHDDGLPPVASFSGEADGWIAVRVEADGWYTFRMTVTPDGPLTISGLSRNYGGDWSSGWSQTTIACGVDLAVDAKAAQHEATHRGPYSCEGAMSYIAWGNSRDAMIVAWAAGDVASWRFDVRGEARVVGVEQGEAIDLRAPDFDRAAAAQVDVGHAGARAGTDGTYPLAVQGLLFGELDGSDWERSSAATPEGPQECPCSFVGRPAGAYTLMTSGAAVSQGPIFAGADVRLPP